MLYDIGTKLVQNLWRNLISRAMRAINGDLQPIQTQVTREGRFDNFHVTTRSTIQTLDAAKLVRCRQREFRTLNGHALDRRLDLGFHLIGKLIPLRSKQLDAVVLIGVVGG